MPRSRCCCRRARSSAAAPQAQRRQGLLHRRSGGRYFAALRQHHVEELVQRRLGELLRLRRQHRGRQARRPAHRPCRGAAQHGVGADREGNPRLAAYTQRLPRSSLGRAIGYTLELWPGLTRFFVDPAIPSDNNHTERAMRGVARGRKNHYGSRSSREPRSPRSSTASSSRPSSSKESSPLNISVRPRDARSTIPVRLPCPPISSRRRLRCSPPATPSHPRRSSAIPLRCATRGAASTYAQPQAVDSLNVTSSLRHELAAMRRVLVH